MSPWFWIPLMLACTGAFVTVMAVGKPRRPLDGPTAAVGVVIQMINAFCIPKGASVL